MESHQNQKINYKNLNQNSEDVIISQKENNTNLP